jgi:hypothetical protein
LVANEDESLSVGAPDNPRRIANIAAGINETIYDLSAVTHSIRCPLWVDGVDKIADERVEALYWSLARDFDPIFSTLRLERDYIDAADRYLAQLTFTRRT